MRLRWAAMLPLHERATRAHLFYVSGGLELSRCGRHVREPHKIVHLPAKVRIDLERPEVMEQAERPTSLHTYRRCTDCERQIIRGSR